jgi:hypothetical protein
MFRTTIITDDKREESDVNHRGPAVRKGAQWSRRDPAVRKGTQRYGRGHNGPEGGPAPKDVAFD